MELNAVGAKVMASFDRVHARGNSESESAGAAVAINRVVLEGSLARHLSLLQKFKAFREAGIGYAQALFGALVGASSTAAYFLYKKGHEILRRGT